MPRRAPVPVLVALLVAVVLVGAAGFAYRRIGIGPGWFEVILGGTIVGSRIDIPVARLRARPTVVRRMRATVAGVHYTVPLVRPSRRTLLSVNLGGALLPTGLAVYLTVADGIWLEALAATAAVTAVVRLGARPVPGVGVVTPILLPPLAAAAVAVSIGGAAVPGLAYVCGTLGTLVGADLLNLRALRDLGGSVASIGGAGTFDGVFLTGILAVVLASL